MKEYYAKSGENLSDNIPITFLIQGDKKEDEMEEFKDYYITNTEKNLNNQWILKPGEFTNRGRGIKISQKFSTIEKYVNNRKRDC